MSESVSISESPLNWNLMMNNLDTNICFVQEHYWKSLYFKEVNNIVRIEKINIFKHTKQKEYFCTIHCNILVLLHYASGEPLTLAKIGRINTIKIIYLKAQLTIEMFEHEMIKLFVAFSDPDTTF